MRSSSLIRNIKNFLIWYFSIIIASLLVLVVIFNWRINQLKSDMTVETESQIVSFSNTFKDEVTQLVSNVFLIKDLIYVHDSLELDGEHTIFNDQTSKLIIQNEFLVWLGMKNDYDQIRILDNTGLEILRVNYNNGNPTPVDDALLQNKGDRYYFTDSIILNEDEVFLSQLDLNIENGEIEVVDGHYKPMIRIASPIFNSLGDKMGVIIINYLADKLFEELDQINSTYSEGIEIINQDGYYLYAIEEDVEFGFMFNDNLDEVFSNYHEYDLFTNAGSNVRTDLYADEYYSSIKISDEELTQNIIDSINRDIQVYSNQESYYIYTEVEFTNLRTYKETVNVFLIIGGIIILIGLLISRLIDEIEFTKNEKLKQIRFDASHDTLTGLYNRRFILDYIRHKKGKGDFFTVLFIDFDGFKDVNDNFGHDIGDLALIAGYKRIQSRINVDHMIARMGGDEFLIVLNSLYEEKSVENICKMIVQSFNVLFDIEGHQFHMGASVGAYINKGQEVSLDEIVNFADQSMYNVKKSGKNNYELYSEQKKV